MKLTALHTTANVYSDDNTPMTHFSERKGHTLTLEQGVITITGPNLTGGRIVSLAGNSATPAPKAK